MRRGSLHAGVGAPVNRIEMGSIWESIPEQADCSNAVPPRRRSHRSRRPLVFCVPARVCQISAQAHASRVQVDPTPQSTALGSPPDISFPPLSTQRAGDNHLNHSGAGLFSTRRRLRAAEEAPRPARPPAVRRPDAMRDTKRRAHRPGFEAYLPIRQAGGTDASLLLISNSSRPCRPNRIDPARAAVVVVWQSSSA